MILPKNTDKFINKLKKENIDCRTDRKILILNSLTADYIFDPSLAVNTYDMTQLPFRVPEYIHEFTALARIYHDQLKIASYLPNHIIAMNYSRIAGEMLKQLRSSGSDIPYVSNWQIFAFFTEDEYLKDLKIKNTSMLDIKADEIVSMLDYPFIKKFEFPIRHNITTKYFFNLVFNNPN